MLHKSKNRLLFFSIVFAGMILGGILGSFIGKVPGLSFFNTRIEFGMAEPLVLNLMVLECTFGLFFRINIMSILGATGGFILAKKII